LNRKENKKTQNKTQNKNENKSKVKLGIANQLKTKTAKRIKQDNQK
jgi:hypothetical protein